MIAKHKKNESIKSFVVAVDNESPDLQSNRHGIVDLKDKQKYLPSDCRIAHSETFNLSAKLSKVKSLSLSDLTQDNEFYHKLQMHKSDSCINSTDLSYFHNNFFHTLIPFSADLKDAYENQQYFADFKATTFTNDSNIFLSKVDRPKSLSMSDLTKDIPLLGYNRRCKSMTESISLVVSHSSFENEWSVRESVSKYVPPSDDSFTDKDSQEIFYGDLDEGRKRRKNAKPSEWAKNKAKEKRMKGEEYLGYRRPRGESVKHDTIRSARELGAACNSDFCRKSKLRGCFQFTEDTRKQIHSNFWKKLNWDQRKIFVTNLVTRSTTNRKTVKNESRRTGTLQYFLPLTVTGDEKVQVCRDMFLNTLSLGAFTVQSWVKKAEFGMSAHQELLNSSRTLTLSKEVKAKMRSLDDFFNKLPKLPSHYARKDTNKLFLEPIYRNLTCLFKVYQEYCASENMPSVSRCTFEKQFHDKNLSLMTLKKDMCDVCSSYIAGNMDEADYQVHVIKKNRAREEKSIDKQKAANKECVLLTMDLEAVKVCPYLTASSLYFKTKLTCHNFTVYNVTTHHCTCYWFNETAADMTSNTFASFLIDYIERHCLLLKLPIIIFSDGCTYQNRNVTLANALLRLSKLHGITIIQKFLVPGHTQMECDSVHSAVERKLKNREIHLPSEYCTITKEACKRNPYEVLEIDYDFVKNYADPKHWVYKSIRPGRKAGDPQVVDIRAIKYAPDSPIQVKLDFNNDWIDLPQRPKVQYEEPYQQLHSDRLPITSTKYEHLQQLKLVIPKDCHLFYDNIPKNT